MALNATELGMILSHLTPLTRPVRAVSLGYPDLLISRRELEELLDKATAARLPVRPDSRAVAGGHERLDLTEIFETGAVFEALGIHLKYCDITAHRGVEEVIDLNLPIPHHLVGAFHLVIDPGTLEHCFNIGQAMVNAARMVAPNGFIYHANPSNHVNHGFHNLSPVFYLDFYAVNGFQVHEYRLPHPVCGQWREPLFADGTTLRAYNQLVVQQKRSGPWMFPNQGSAGFPQQRDQLRAWLTQRPRRLLLSPAGAISRELLGHLDLDQTELRISDAHKAGSTLADIPIISHQQALAFNPDKVLITSTSFAHEIRQTLTSLGLDPAIMETFTAKPAGAQKVPGYMLSDGPS